MIYDVLMLTRDGFPNGNVMRIVAAGHKEAAARRAAGADPSHMGSDGLGMIVVGPADEEEDRLVIEGIKPIEEQRFLLVHRDEGYVAVKDGRAAR